MNKIIFVTDYVCPYCIVGKKALLEAIKELKLDVSIETCPMELTVRPEPQVDTWHDENRREHYKILFKPAADLGLDCKFPPHIVPRPYTDLAFEGHYYAQDHGKADSYDDAVYGAYFIDEKDIGDPDLLKDLAEQVGLDGDAFSKALKEGSYRAREKEADSYSKNVLDVHSVPTMIIGGEKVQFEDYSKEDAIKILKKYFAI